MQHEYVTLNRKLVRFEGPFIKTLAAFKSKQLVRILFEETYYDNGSRPYSVLCIERPLEVRIDFNSWPLAHVGMFFCALLKGGGRGAVNHVKLASVTDAVELLFPGGQHAKARAAIEAIIQRTRTEMESVTDPEELVGVARRAFPNVTHAFSKNGGTLTVPHATARQLQALLSISLEAFFIDALYDLIDAKLRQAMAMEEANLNRAANLLLDVSLVEMGGPLALSHAIERSVEAIRGIHNASTPLEKLVRFKRSMSLLNAADNGSEGMLCSFSVWFLARWAPPKVRAASPADRTRARSAASAVTITSDDLVPALIYIAVHARNPSWLVTIYFAQQFRFSGAYSDHSDFALSSFQVAIEHLRTGGASANAPAVRLVTRSAPPRAHSRAGPP